MAKDAKVVEAKSPEPESPTNTKKGALLPPSDLSGSEEGGYATEKNPFADPVAAEHWRQVYEKSRYECRHVFDPNLTWTEEEEKRLVRKLDWRIRLLGRESCYYSRGVTQSLEGKCGDGLSSG